MSRPPAVIRVTADHIAKGEPLTHDRCPIALALREQGGYTQHQVCVTEPAVHAGRSGFNYHAQLPDKAREFVFYFDRRMDVAPFEFEVIWRTEP